MKELKSYSPVERERAVRLVFEDMAPGSQYFEDTVHYSTLTGENIIRCIFTTCDDGFQMTTLNSSSIEGYLSSVKSLKDEYPQCKPRDYALLKKWLKNAPKKSNW